ncbi:unnamed protein product (macronuclear) [Paramecium tetraurelia]|uniref:Uncharacterized protein n=1 Tax=Paramecium tetraurelia TaxID=5888 RepID=A0DFU6_PARTE|nr:uncharacterized protein GSPATT00016726001 [Paramecium tetraurelia]CAK81913.1 unnamed protein product [Paramecium tetraurelia]|eukprot:XP_001449310.1 hypothetical protein (macronuclear) [Paramecium tetraurelia strain d4-2]
MDVIIDVQNADSTYGLQSYDRGDLTTQLKGALHKINSNCIKDDLLLYDTTKFLLRIMSNYHSNTTIIQNYYYGKYLRCIRHTLCMCIRIHPKQS